MAKPKKGKQKPTKMSKSGAKEKTFLFFNSLDFKTMTAESLIEHIYTNATNVLDEHELSMNVWCTFDHREKHVIDLWDADSDFIRFWLDQLVSEVGHMIWNEVHKKYWNEEWYRDGILHNVPELPKKLRANPEAVATHFADSTVNKYEGHYK